MRQRPLRIDVITAFPAMFSGFLGESLMARGLGSGILDVRVHDLRKWSDDPQHHSIDDTPFGGGGGMILKAEPIARAVEALGGGPDGSALTIIPTPHGTLFDQDHADELAQADHLIFVCGHYTGMDERIFDYLKPMRRCIGDYVLSGGELPSMVMIEATARRIPGFLGNEDSASGDSFVRDDGGLGAPQYTRPAEWRGLSVPAVLLSGHHAQVADWREEQAREYTDEYRPDLNTRRRSRQNRAEFSDFEDDVGGEG